MGTAVVAVVIIAFLLSRGSGKGTGNNELPPGTVDPTDPAKPPKPDPDKPTPQKPDEPNRPKPTTDPKTPKPKKVPARAFGKPTTLPDWFDTQGNSFWISPDCDYVAEGAQFLQNEGHGRNVMAVQQPTLAETLATKVNGTPNTAWGFVDFLVEVDGYTAAGAIAVRFIQEAAPLCADLPYAQWPIGLRQWAEDFQNRIVSHVELLVYGGDD